MSQERIDPCVITRTHYASGFHRVGNGPPVLYLFFVVHKMHTFMFAYEYAFRNVYVERQCVLCLYVFWCIIIIIIPRPNVAGVSRQSLSSQRPPPLSVFCYSCQRLVCMSCPVLHPAHPGLKYHFYYVNSLHYWSIVGCCKYVLMYMYVIQTVFFFFKLHQHSEQMSRLTCSSSRYSVCVGNDADAVHMNSDLQLKCGNQELFHKSTLWANNNLIQTRYAGDLLQ